LDLHIYGKTALIKRNTSLNVKIGATNYIKHSKNN